MAIPESAVARTAASSLGGMAKNLDTGDNLGLVSTVLLQLFDDTVAYLPSSLGLFWGTNVSALRKFSSCDSLNFCLRGICPLSNISVSFAARVFDYFDSGVMERLQHRLLELETSRTQGRLAETPGNSMALTSQVSWAYRVMIARSRLDVTVFLIALLFFSDFNEESRDGRQDKGTATMVSPEYVSC